MKALHVGSLILGILMTVSCFLPWIIIESSVDIIGHSASYPSDKLHIV